MYSFGVLLCEMCISPRGSRETNRADYWRCVQKEPWVRPNMNTVISKNRRCHEKWNKLWQSAQRGNTRVLEIFSIALKNWFPCGMTSEKRAQKFHTDDVHYPDLGRTSDWLKQISDTTNQKLIWLVTRHQYGISALVFQTSRDGETRGGVSKYLLVSQAKATHFLPPYNKF